MGLQITLVECGWGITDADDGSGAKNLVLQDPKSGIVVIAPLPPETAKEMGSKLMLSQPSQAELVLLSSGGNGHPLPRR